MKEYKRGEIHSFYVTEIKEVNERKYIYLSDGEKDTYRVKPYDFQLEWEPSNIPTQMKAYVRDVNIYGLPLLEQVYADVLAYNYQLDDDEPYAFKLSGIYEDTNTQAKYYQLKDAFGLFHRYYPRPEEPNREVNDFFSLQVAGIESKDHNKAYLDLKPAIENFAAEIEPKEPVATSEAQVESVDDNDFTLGNENNVREFKSTLVFPAGDVTADIDRQMLIICKTIAGLMNKDGGELFIGVNDRGRISGIEGDFPYLNSSSNDNYSYQLNTDGYENKIRSTVKYILGSTANSNIDLAFSQQDSLTYCRIKINQVMKPVFVNGTKLFQRAGNMTQLIKGDEITWFIEDRQRMRETGSRVASTVKHENAEVIEEDEAVMPAEPIDDINQLLASKSEAKIWFYMAFYVNGDWSFDKNPADSSDLVYQIPIPVFGKKHRLAMVYDNGKINMVVPYDQLVPKGKNGRKQRKKQSRYKNGWNIASKIKSMFLVSDTDLIAIKSIRSDGSSLIKVHEATAISVHSTLQLAGNMVVNPELNADLEWAKPVPGHFKNLISSVLLKNHQTSGFLGFPVTDRSFIRTYRLIEKIVNKA